MVSTPFDDSPGTLPSTIAAGRFAVGQRLSAGCFGEVHLAKDKETGEEVAVKFEDLFSGFLQKEAETLKKLQEPNQSRPQGFARLLHSGVEANGYRCMVMDRLGSNLLQHMNAFGGNLSIKTTLLVAKQAIPILEYLHSKRMVHRDIKPENFVSGLRERAHHLYLVDFGLAVEYHTGRSHVPLMPTTCFQGNFRYASSGAHRCQTQSRKDDLEALGYMLVFLARGTLPWTNIKHEDWRQRSKKILEMKQATKPAELAKGLPEVFAELLQSSLALDFEERPDYELLRDSFENELADLAEAEGIARVEDSALQWVDSSSLPNLVPVRERKEVRQPDDMTISLTRSIHKLRTITRRTTTSRTPRSLISNMTGASRTPESDSDSYLSNVAKRFSNVGQNSNKAAEMSPTKNPTFGRLTEDENERLRSRLRRITVTFLSCGSLSGAERPQAMPPLCSRKVGALTPH